VAGIWVPAEAVAGAGAEAGDDFWRFYAPQSFEKKLLITEEAFFGPVAEKLPLPVNEAAWRAAFDGSGVHSEHVPGLLRRIDEAQIGANVLLPHTDLESSPALALRRFRQDALALAGLLFVFSAPVLGLAIYFLGLVASMLVRRQRSEIAVLRSRGASRRWVAAVYLLEWSLLGGIALAAGLGLGTGLARIVGQTRSFLDFTPLAGGISGAIPLRLTASALGMGLAITALAILFSLLPAWQAGRDTIVSYKQERARSRRRPLWQRMGLDVLLLLPSLYGLYTLRAQGRLELFGRALGKASLSANPLENPLLFLLPTLFMIALSLFLLRLLPGLLAGLAWLAGRLPYPTPVLALRQLSRSAGGGAAYLGPLMLMVITLSLAGFVASMAHTLDRSLADSAYYAVGADLNLVEGGEYTGETPEIPGNPLQQPNRPPEPPSSSDEPAVWNFLPVSDHLSLPGVLAAARVGRYEAALSAGGRRAEGRLLGIDRTEFPSVAFYRPDFAAEGLVGLMNRLAWDPAALLVDRVTWERFHLNTGDQVELRVNVAGETRTTGFKVAGLLDYCPTLYPEDGPFFLANLEYLFESWGGLQPYDVWLRTAPQADPQAIVAGINNLGVAVIWAQDARSQVEQAYAAPNRQGVLGLLSVGFLAASALTVVGFLLYALLSFRERFIQLGVLRAIGLTRAQMGAALALEQFFLVLAGLAAGTGIGVLAAWLFIPHLPVAASPHPGTPPYLVEIAWGDILRVYAIFGVMMLAGTTVTLVSLARIKIFQAVKLGETV
jgi:putative ABC transport system permease protein